MFDGCNESVLGLGFFFGFKLAEVVFGGSLFGFVAVADVFQGAAVGGLLLGGGNLLLAEAVVIAGHGALVLPGLGAGHGAGDEVGGVEGGFGRRLHGERRGRGFFLFMEQKNGQRSKAHV